MRAGIRARPWAGLDVGTYSIKLFAAQGPGPGAHHWMAEVPLPPSPDGNGAGPPSDVVSRAISEALARSGLAPRQFRGITMGISGSDVILKQITLPLLEESEVRSALRFEARKHLPFDPQAMVIDYQILRRDPAEKRLEVLLAAVSQEHLDAHLEPVRRLDLDVDIVDATPLALTNALIQQLPAAHEPLALLDLGHASSHLTIWQAGEPFFGRRLDFGGRALTRAIARATQGSLDQAEAWKRAAGPRTDPAGPEMQAILGALRQGLADELRRSIAFYRTIANLPDTLTLRISGGTARLPDLPRRLGEMLEIPVALFDPIGDTDPDQVAPHFVQAFGLSLRAA